MSLCFDSKFHLEMKRIAGLSEQAGKEHCGATLNCTN